MLIIISKTTILVFILCWLTALALKFYKDQSFQLSLILFWVLSSSIFEYLTAETCAAPAQQVNSSSWFMPRSTIIDSILLCHCSQIPICLLRCSIEKKVAPASSFYRCRNNGKMKYLWCGSQQIQLQNASQTWVQKLLLQILISLLLFHIPLISWQHQDHWDKSF